MVAAGALGAIQHLGFLDYPGYILGLYRDDGKENGNYRDYIGVI